MSANTFEAIPPHSPATGAMDPERVRDLAEKFATKIEEQCETWFFCKPADDIPTEVWDYLAGHESEEVRAMAAQWASRLSDAWLDKLMTDANWSVLRTLAGNYGNETPRWALMKLTSDCNRTIAGLAEAALSDLDAILDIEVREARETWVVRKRVFNYSQVIISELVAHPDVMIRRKIASSEHAPAYVLLQLAQDPDDVVRSEVCRNANTPTEALLLLARDTATRVRMDLVHARGEALPTEALEILEADKTMQLSLKLMRHEKWVSRP